MPIRLVRLIRVIRRVVSPRFGRLPRRTGYRAFLRGSLIILISKRYPDVDAVGEVVDLISGGPF